MPAPKQQNISLDAINQRIWKHLEERDWHKDSSRGLAISLSLEANELLEHYQWGEKPVGNTEAVSEELADVLIYAIQIAQQNNIDIAKAIEQKLQKAAIKYPTKEFKGKDASAQHNARIKAKLAHKKAGL